MNTALLRKIKRTILARPKRVDMYEWVSNRPTNRGGPVCGTVGCVAGWACLLTEKAGKGLADKRDAILGIDFHGRALRVLGITKDQGKRLFYVDGWPNEARCAYEDAWGEPKHMAQIVAARIDQFIRSKGKL